MKATNTHNPEGSPHSFDEELRQLTDMMGAEYIPASRQEAIDRLVENRQRRDTARDGVRFYDVYATSEASTSSPQINDSKKALWLIVAGGTHWLEEALAWEAMLEKLRQAHC